MKTTLRSQSKEIIIDPDGPFTIIGEKINPTGRKKLAAHLKEHDFDYIRDLALKQVEAGADLLDVNVGVPGEDEVALLPEVCQVMMAATEAPLCIDSPNKETLAAALAVVSGKPVVNSVNGEEKSDAAPSWASRPRTSSSTRSCSRSALTARRAGSRCNRERWCGKNSGTMSILAQQRALRLA